MQEGVAIEVAEAVLQSLKGELSSNTVNAPMVPAETLIELQPYITLSQGLGKTAVQLVSEQGFAGAPPAARPRRADSSAHVRRVSPFCCRRQIQPPIVALPCIPPHLDIPDVDFPKHHNVRDVPFLHLYRASTALTRRAVPTWKIPYSTHSNSEVCINHADVNITYRSSRGSDLDTRLLRANVIKGILEEITTANVNMVNADLLAEQRGLRITETITKTDRKAIVSEMKVAIGTPQSKFSGAVVDDCISVSVRYSAG